jgi:hypothetical protein
MRLWQCKNDAELIIRIAKEELVKSCGSSNGNAVVDSDDKTESQLAEDKNQTHLPRTLSSVAEDLPSSEKKSVSFLFV